MRDLHRLGRLLGRRGTFPIGPHRTRGTAGTLVVMPEEHRRRVDTMLEPEFLDGLAQRSMEDVRALHEECLTVETEVSFVRRLAQARIDIVEAELDRRARSEERRVGKEWR